MEINKHSFYISNQLANRSRYLHGFSTREHGDMRNPDKRRGFLQLLGITKPLYLAKQVHGDRIVGTSGEVMEADAIISSNSDYAIGVLTADCVPLLFADKKGKSVGVVHAGWKGTAKGISRKMVSTFSDLGIPVEDIHVSVGPHIGMCCYSVEFGRAQQFSDQFSRNPEVIQQFDDGWHIDIGKMNVLQLHEAGVKRENIDAGVFCTQCQSPLFYSSRKDNGNISGEMLAVISFT